MQKRAAHTAFTLIELIFVIVIIGVLSAVAIPQFANLTSNSKSASELATASSVQSALDAIHGEWITNTCTFEWGNVQQSDDASPGGLNTSGYPRSLDSTAVFDRIFKTPNKDWEKLSSCPDGSSFTCYRGPASKSGSGVKDKANKPDEDEYWIYNDVNGTFTLKE
jgi:prepilin-type N-terminal cleavage/methylation domain-containing protein